MGRPKKSDSEKSNNSASMPSSGKIKDAFPGEIYQKPEPKGDEYSHEIDSKPNELAQNPVSKGDYDAIDPSEIPSKTPNDKNKNKKENPEDFIDFDDEHEVKEPEEPEENEDTEKPEDSEDPEENDNEEDFDDELIERAIDAGMNEDDILEFDSEKELKKYVRALEISNRKYQEKKGDDIPSSKKPDENKSGKIELEEFKLDLSKDVYEPKVVEALEGLNKHYHSKLIAMSKKTEELEAKLNEREQKEIQREMNENQIKQVNQFDSVLKSLISDKDNGEFWKKEFGEGDALTIKKGTPQHKKRSALYSDFIDFLEIDIKKGRNSSIESIVKKALNSRYEGSSLKIAKTELSEKLKNRKKLFTERPNSKDPGNAGLTRKQIAIKNARAKIEAKRSER